MLRIAVADDEPVITKQMERILCKVCGNWELEIQPSQPVREYPTGELFRLEGMDVDRDGKSEETVTVKREFVGEEVCDTLVVQFTDGRQYVEHMVVPDEAALPRVHAEMVDGLMPGIPLLAVTLTSRTSNYGASDIHFFKLASEEEEIGLPFGCLWKTGDVTG